MENTKSHLQKLQDIKKRDVEVLLKKSYRGIWESAIKEYSDSAHFVYELLQNADDTKATWVEFILDKDGLWFKHNGTLRFTISEPDNEDQDSEKGTLGHINAITSIGNSSKIDDQKIGKFGIGFKAVFAYSLTPHVYDEIFNFKLENYIVPSEIPANTTRRNKGETLFYFPFNHSEKSKELAYKEIEEKLSSLSQPLLFLSHLKKIIWSSTEKNGSYTKNLVKSERFELISALLFEVTKTENDVIENQLIWIFTKEVIHKQLKSSHRIAVGFFVTEQQELEVGYHYDAFCFFPTKEETKLGFIIQAPFLLTVSREGIKAGEDWNIELIQLVADLSAEAILLLKQIGISGKTYLINDSILDLIPYKDSDFSNTLNKSRISFWPFYYSILNKFKNEKLLPGIGGKYFAYENAYWASDPDLVDLFSDNQISELTENPNSGWVFVSKGQKQLNQANKPLEAYINSIVIDVLDPKKLLRRIKPAFIEAQSDIWLIKFYNYLGGRKWLWDDKEKLALRRPILLNQNRIAVVPFEEDLMTPNIFLPTNRATSYDTIYEPFIEDVGAFEFFKLLGVGMPDLRAEIFKTIIPNYNDESIFDSSVSKLMHFDSFLLYLTICPIGLRTDFINKLKEIKFVAAREAGNFNIKIFCKPEEVYFPSNKIKTYFNNTLGVYILDEEFYFNYLNDEKRQNFNLFLVEIGLCVTPRLLKNNLEISNELKEKLKIDRFQINKKYNENQSITDVNLEGLDETTNQITLELSKIIWEFLLEIIQGKKYSAVRDLLCGSFKFFAKGDKYYRIEKFDSTLITILKTKKWLFDLDNQLVSASMITIEQMSSQYNNKHDSVDSLYELLGIRSDYTDSLLLNNEQQIAINLGRKLIKEGITEADISAYIDEISQRKKNIADNKNAIIKTPDSEIKDEYDKALLKLKDVLKTRKTNNARHNINDSSFVPTDITEIVDDQDDYLMPSVNLQKKIDKLKDQTETQIEDLSRIENLNKIVNESEKYSFTWFKSLLELEYLSSSEANSQGKELSIQFLKVDKELGTERTLILRNPNRYIPQSIEDIGDLQIRLYHGEESQSITIEVVSVKEYTLRAKVKKSADISDIDLTKVTKVVIDIKNPVFILEELRKAFFQLNLEDKFNLQHNLTSNIRFIFGPPGTGKTTYLATDEIIPLMQKEQYLKVLVLTPTNKAADVLTKRIIDKMGSDQSYYNWLLRFGNTGYAELENSSLLVDKKYDIRNSPRNTTISTIARFAYDYFQTDTVGERLYLKTLHWDYIIIDEASMVTLASISYVLYQKPEAFFIIAGDPFQIQPITQIEQWKDMNIYTMVQLDRFVNPLTVPHQYEIKNLNKQYRSIPSIGNLFSHFAYNGILDHHRTQSEQKALSIKGLTFKDINIIKFPVSKYESIYKPNTLNKSNYQVYSALFTAEFVHNLAKQIELSHSDRFRIGVICPYKAQATLVEKIIAQQLINTEKIDVLIGTIHGFQGDECDIIISIFNPPFSISKHPGMFLNKQNILNVSISRAKDYLFILMPDDNTPDIENLHQIKTIESLVHKHAKDRVSVYHSEKIEEMMFGSRTFVYDNSFATSHQSINVYSRPEKKYEVRCEEIAIDIQIRN